MRPIADDLRAHEASEDGREAATSDAEKCSDPKLLHYAAEAGDFWACFWRSRFCKFQTEM